MDAQIHNLHIKSQDKLISPKELLEQIPLSTKATQTVLQGRETIKNILLGKDKRLLVIVGPCSIHDIDAGIEYANNLQQLAAQLEDDLFIVMRTYFEKPRTTIGWKGLINDPYIDGSLNMTAGLSISRKFLLDVNNLGLPAATEALDPILPQYIQDLISWSAIGARTTESQVHRSMASGLSMPVGFKNATSGEITVAINAIKSCESEHSFLGIDTHGMVNIVNTQGNPHSHVILRGGNNGANYSQEHINNCEKLLRNKAMTPNIMVDCSHANSNKDHNNQPLVLTNIQEQILSGNKSIMGIMLESHLHAGNQAIGDPQSLKYGVSITDACIAWETTANILTQTAKTLSRSLHSRIRHQ